MKNLNLGMVVTTAFISSKIAQNPQFAVFCQKSLERHKTGDWGDLEDEDKETNEDALINEGRVFSSYLLSEEVKKEISVNEEKIWIITEWDRSETTILFPSEY